MERGKWKSADQKISNDSLWIWQKLLAWWSEDFCNRQTCSFSYTVFFPIQTLPHTPHAFTIKETHLKWPQSTSHRASQWRRRLTAVASSWPPACIRQHTTPVCRQRLTWCPLREVSWSASIVGGCSQNLKVAAAQFCRCENYICFWKSWYV